MSEKLIGRIENSQTFMPHTSTAQECWSATNMRAMMDRQQIAQVPSEFGQFQLSDDSQSRQLHAGITKKEQVQNGPASSYTDHSDYAQQKMRPPLHAGTDKQHHTHLSGSANDKSHAHQDTKPSAQKHHAGYTRSTKIEATHDQQMVNHPAETVQAHMPSSVYKTGEKYPLISIPNQPGHENYYNGLQNAHFENNTLYGTPVHIDANHKVTNALNHQIAIPLHHQKN